MMRISCHNCGKDISLPQDKLPNASRFRVKCPSCGERTTVDRYGEQESEAASAGAMEASRETRPAGGESEADLQEEREGPTAGALEDGLVYVREDGLREALRQTLEKQGYQMVIAGSVKEAVRLFRSHVYSLLVMEESEECAPLLGQMRSLPGNTRREINCILVGDEGESLDMQQAFLKGVNAYLNRRDKHNFPELLRRAIMEYRQFLRPWLIARGEE